MIRRCWLAGVIFTGVFFGSGSGETARAQECGEVLPKGPLRYEVVATAPRLNRQVMGPVLSFIQGVPAEPVDSFTYDGVGSVAIEGRIRIVVDPVAEVGVVEASWNDHNGEWSLLQTRFIHPDHLSGVRLGSSASVLETIVNEGIVHNIYLHGDTGAALPILPTLFNHMAAWGPVDILLDGEPFENPYEFPAPQWKGHIMVTEGVRRTDGTVRTINGEIYDPMMTPDQGAAEEGDLEVHLTWHDEHFPATTNFPPIYSFFYHLVFEDVSIRIVENDAPIVLEPCQPPPVEIRQRPFPTRDPGR